VFLQLFNFCEIYSFSSHNSDSTYARTTIKGSRDVAAGDLWPKKVAASAVAGAGVKWMYKAR